MRPDRRRPGQRERDHHPQQGGAAGVGRKTAGLAQDHVGLRGRADGDDPADAQLLPALLQLGELDYIWTYVSIARTNGFRWLDLPPEINLSDPAQAATYAEARVVLPGATRTSDSVEFRGEPIVYALTIPRNAPHPEAAEAFVRFVYSTAGQRILAEAGLQPLSTPVLGGPGQPPLSLRGLFPTSGTP